MMNHHIELNDSESSSSDVTITAVSFLTRASTEVIVGSDKGETESHAQTIQGHRPGFSSVVDSSTIQCNPRLFHTSHQETPPSPTNQIPISLLPFLASQATNEQNQLELWAYSLHRHERLAYLFEQPPNSYAQTQRLTDGYLAFVDQPPSQNIQTRQYTDENFGLLEQPPFIQAQPRGNYDWTSSTEQRPHAYLETQQAPHENLQLGDQPPVDQSQQFSDYDSTFFSGQPLNPYDQTYAGLDYDLAYPPEEFFYSRIQHDETEVQEDQ